MNEINRGVRHIVQDHVADRHGVDTTGAEVGGDDDFCVGQGARGGSVAAALKQGRRPGGRTRTRRSRR